MSSIGLEIYKPRRHEFDLCISVMNDESNWLMMGPSERAIQKLGDVMTYG